MRQEEPEYLEVYRKKYGDFHNLCKELSFAEIGKVSHDVSEALIADVPSFVRLNNVYGDNASTKWLYSHLKNLLASSGILKEKMSNEQIEILAGIITNNYPTLKLTEFMLFESRFLGGKYEEFYGETSYTLAITRSLNQFRKDLNTIYAQIEREQEAKALEEKSPSCSWEEFCRERGMEGKPLPGTAVSEPPVKIRTVLHKVKPLTEMEVGINSAHGIIDNIYHLEKAGVNNMRYAFKLRYGCTPEEYLKNHEEVRVVEDENEKKQ